jgi:hypothetical protein
MINFIAKIISPMPHLKEISDYLKKHLKFKLKVLAHSSMAELLPSIQKGQNSISSTAKRKNEKSTPRGQAFGNL